MIKFTDIVKQLNEQLLLTEQVRPNTYDELASELQDLFLAYRKKNIEYTTSDGIKFRNLSGDQIYDNNYDGMAKKWWDSLSDKQKALSPTSNIERDNDGNDIRTLKYINPNTGQLFTEKELADIEAESGFQAGSFNPANGTGKCRKGYVKEYPNNPKSPCIDEDLKDGMNWYEAGEKYLNEKYFGIPLWELITGLFLVGVANRAFGKPLQALFGPVLKSIGAAIKSGAKWIGNVIINLCKALGINLYGRYKKKKLSIMNELAMKLASKTGDITAQLQSGNKTYDIINRSISGRQLGAALEAFAKVAKIPAVQVEAEATLLNWVRTAYKEKIVHPEAIVNIMGGNFAKTREFQQLYKQYSVNKASFENSIRILGVSPKGIKNIQKIGDKASKTLPKGN